MINKLVFDKESPRIFQLLAELALSLVPVLCEDGTKEIQNLTILTIYMELDDE